MPVWPEYLDALERYVEDTARSIEVRPAGAGVGAPAADFDHPRPLSPLPAPLAARALSVLARLESVRAAGEARRLEILVARQRLARRLTTAGSERPTLSASL